MEAVREAHVNAVERWERAHQVRRTQYAWRGARSVVHRAGPGVADVLRRDCSHEGRPRPDVGMEARFLLSL